MSLPDEEVWFPGSDVRFSDVRYHYRRVAAELLPHLRGRPLVVDRFHDGPRGAEGCDDIGALLRLARAGALGFQAGTWRTERPDGPDRLLFDIDPPGDDFGPARDVALRLREALEELGLPSWLQVTGSRGVHVVVPLDKKVTFAEAAAVGKGVAGWLALRAPDEVVAGPSQGGLVGVDAGRNAPEGCAVVPYSVRRFEGGPVAAPITWEELTKKNMHARRFDLGNLYDRLERVGDPWALMSRHGRSLKLPLKKLAKRLDGVETLAAK